MKGWTKFTQMDKSKYFNEVKGLIEMGQFVNSQAWNVNDFNFDKGSTGSLDSIVAVTASDMVAMKMSLVTVKTSGTFKLAPNKFLWNKGGSYAGGIYENNKDMIKTEARDITKDDVKVINALMILSTMETMAKGFGIDFKLPTNDPLKL